jgi:hypothetical protein
MNVQYALTIADDINSDGHVLDTYELDDGHMRTVQAVYAGNGGVTGYGGWHGYESYATPRARNSAGSRVKWQWYVCNWKQAYAVFAGCDAAVVGVAVRTAWCYRRVRKPCWL